MSSTHTTIIITSMLALTTSAAAQSSSLMAQRVEAQQEQVIVEGDEAPPTVSMYAVQPPKIREFQRHDLVQIIVRETSRAVSSQELETEKEIETRGEIAAFPDLQLSDLLEFQLFAGRAVDLPRVDISLEKERSHEGDYERRDDLTARLTAEVIDILPNGNLILEARTQIMIDEEIMTMRVTGICRSKDVTAANTVNSNQIHDLKIEKVHEGQLKEANERGIVAKVFDAIFAW